MQRINGQFDFYEFMEEWIVGMKKDRVAPSCFSCGFGYGSDRGVYIEDVEGIQRNTRKKSGKAANEYKSSLLQRKME
ncbi:MAG: hypothetical protein BAA00_07950 [Parageobacillus thermoglucosidasius]|nr:MAG: hypothetical protein BAA00_07950 [Parageobacillus thermoglucosidasius]RDE27878.1 hypothetical protein DV714_08105 [Parageobacillus thermoglucosidasius]RDE34178.1 hypothetical protein DV713_08790 [Parageobacillus thermoglucosidasius]